MTHKGLVLLIQFDVTVMLRDLRPFWINVIKMIRMPNIAVKFSVNNKKKIFIFLDDILTNK